MNRYSINFKLMSLLLIFVVLISAAYMFNQKSNPAITYFPLDTTSQFESASTNLNLQPSNDSYKIQWHIKSKTDKPLYVRQDVSLLYKNGLLKGARSKWIEDADVIQFNDKIKNKNTALWESISFHHGENHLSGGEIKSIQHMTHDYLYVSNSLNQKIKDLSKSQNLEDKTFRHQIDHEIKNVLHYHWDELIKHFNIDINNYFTMPLTNLYQFNDKSLPDMTQQQTQQVLGQLWEGLYKNYIIPAVNTKNNKSTGYIPLILFDKKNEHLIVLFELNNEKEMLIQRFPSFS